MKTKKINEDMFMYEVTNEMIDNSDFNELGKMFLKKKALNYKDTTVRQWHDSFNKQCGNIMIDITMRDELKNYTVSEAYFKTNFQLCRRFDNDFEDCEELANMKLADFYDLSHEDQYRFLYKIDTACRSQIYYVANITFKYKENDVTTPFIDWVINYF